MRTGRPGTIGFACRRQRPTGREETIRVPPRRIKVASTVRTNGAGNIVTANTMLKSMGHSPGAARLAGEGIIKHVRTLQNSVQRALNPAERVVFEFVARHLGPPKPGVRQHTPQPSQIEMKQVPRHRQPCLLTKFADCNMLIAYCNGSKADAGTVRLVPS